MKCPEFAIPCTIQFSPKAAKSIQAFLDRSETNEIAIGIIGKGVGYYTSGGVSEESRFDIGSISKTFTAQVILRLVSEGKLSLEDTADRYLPLKKGKYPTIAQLLTHTAGYGHLTPVEITVPHLLAKGYASKNLYRRVDRKRVLAALSRRKRTKACNRYGYSDFAYAILALIAEEILQQPFCEIMNRYLTEELGLANTEAYPTADRVAVYQGKKLLKPWTWEQDNPYMAGGGVVSTLADMVSYARVQLTDTRPFLLSAQTVHAPSFSAKSNIGTCFGWHTYKKSNQLWHVGGVGMFRSSMIVNRHLGYGVVVLGNASGGRSANVHYIAKLLYSELKKKRIRITEAPFRKESI